MCVGCVRGQRSCESKYGCSSLLYPPRTLITTYMCGCVYVSYGFTLLHRSAEPAHSEEALLGSSWQGSDQAPPEAHPPRKGEVPPGRQHERGHTHAPAHRTQGLSLDGAGTRKGKHRTGKH